MSLDIKFMTLCDHTDNGKTYLPELCPKCHNLGYYFDIKFDAGGQTITASGSDKLQQESVKVLLDEQQSSLFFPEWGSEIYNFIGQKNTLITRSRLEMAIRRALERLKEIQEYESTRNASITDDEIIKDVEYVQLDTVSVTTWACHIIISSASNELNEFILTV